MMRDHAPAQASPIRCCASPGADMLAYGRSLPAAMATSEMANFAL